MYSFKFKLKFSNNRNQKQGFKNQCIATGSLQFARVDNDEKLSGPLKLDIRSYSLLYIIIIIIKYKQIPIHFYDQ